MKVHRTQVNTIGFTNIQPMGPDWHPEELAAYCFETMITSVFYSETEKKEELSKFYPSNLDKKISKFLK